MQHGSQVPCCIGFRRREPTRVLLKRCTRPVKARRNAQQPLCNAFSVWQTSLDQVCSKREGSEQPFAFKDLMIHLILQFTLHIAFRGVLHRCANQEIHRCKVDVGFCLFVQNHLVDVGWKKVFVWWNHHAYNFILGLCFCVCECY